MSEVCSWGMASSLSSGPSTTASTPGPGPAIAVAASMAGKYRMKGSRSTGTQLDSSAPAAVAAIIASAAKA